MKSIADRIHSYSDQHLESILWKRNGYEEEVVQAAIQEAKLRGWIETDDEVNSKYPLIPGDEQFGEAILKKISYENAFEPYKRHYLLIGYVAVGVGFLALFQGLFIAPILPALYIYGVYRLGEGYHRLLHRVVHVAAYMLAFMMVVFVMSVLRGN
jgi:hypothetical protein